MNNPYQEAIDFLGYPTYVRLADLVWLEADPLGTWRHILRREPDTMAEFERLQALPLQQERYDYDNYVEWREQIERGKLTEHQLRHSLLTHYDPRYIDMMLDRTLRARTYPSLKVARDYGGLHLVINPDGVTEELCYEFRSVGSPAQAARQLQAMRLLTQLEAYLLARPTILAQVYIRQTSSDEQISEPLDAKLAEAYLAKAERILQEATSKVAAHLNSQPSPTVEEQA